VGLTVGIRKWQADKPPEPKEDLDELMGVPDDLDI
jgi:hypothetical protein